MNSDDSKLKTELLTKTFKLCDKIDKDYQEIIKNINVSLEETLKECKKLMECIWEEQHNLMLLSNQIKPRINYDEIVKTIALHKHKVVKLFAQLRKITSKNNCYQCKSQLSNQLYIYFPLENKTHHWTINKTIEANWDIITCYCNENCFKQSPDYKHHQRKKKSKKNKSENIQQTENEQQFSEETYICASCFTEKSGEYRYHLTKNDQKKFCSSNCFNDFYGELCFKCHNKFLTAYHWNKEKYPNIVYCLECYQKEKQEQEYWAEKHTSYCRYCKDKLREGEIFDFCDKEECAKQASDEWAKDNGIKVEDDINLDWEQMRTNENKWEQMRTNENKWEQMRTNENKWENIDNLNAQIKNLHQEITQLENSNNSQPPNLLNLKKNELTKLESKLKENNQQSEQKNNNSKLILGIGSGILGLGLIGLIIYLITKKEKSR